MSHHHFSLLTQNNSSAFTLVEDISCIEMRRFSFIFMALLLLFLFRSAENHKITGTEASVSSVADQDEGSFSLEKDALLEVEIKAKGSGGHGGGGGGAAHRTKSSQLGKKTSDAAPWRCISPLYMVSAVGSFICFLFFLG